MNEASTSISMELTPGAYEQPIICDGDSCSFDYEGTWIACNTNSINPGGDDNFTAKRETLVIGSGKLKLTEEYLITDNGSCGGAVGLTLKKEANISDNGSKKFVSLNSDNVSASKFEMDFQSVKLSFNDLSYIQGLKPDNETYLCGESYWTGVDRDIMGCNFKNDSFGTSRTFKAVAYVSENNSLRFNAKDDYPDSFGCSIYALKLTENYVYPICTGNEGYNVSFSADNISESNGDLKFTIRLNSNPKTEVNIPINVSDTDNVLLSDQNLIFNHSDWNVEKTVTLSSIDNLVDEENKLIKISFGPSQSENYYYKNLNKNYDITLVDDDSANLKINLSSNETSESGDVVLINLVLESKPLSEVLIPISSNDINEGSLNKSIIVFSPSNWDTEQTVLVQGVDDNLIDGDKNYSIEFGQLTTTDLSYSGLNIDAINLINKDDDVINLVAAGDNGLILNSKNGTEWNTINSESDQILESAAFGNNVFVLGGRGGTLLSSNDGNNWISRDANYSYNHHVNELKFLNNYFIATGHWMQIRYSPNAESWSKGYPYGIQWPLRAVGYGNGTYISAGDGNMLKTSSNLVSWTNQTDLTGSIEDFFYGENTFLAVGKNIIYKSSNGISWTELSNKPNVEQLRRISSGNNIYIIVGDNGVLLKSSDMNNWNLENTNTNTNLNSVTFYNSLFYIVGDNGLILTYDGNIVSTKESGTNSKIWAITSRE
tara:strand:- start:495 stop:2639 length:2145 start_codon:yes stop_codon:yes gene_type:complete